MCKSMEKCPIDADRKELAAAQNRTSGGSR